MNSVSAALHLHTLSYDQKEKNALKLDKPFSLASKENLLHLLKDGDH